MHPIPELEGVGVGASSLWIGNWMAEYARLYLAMKDKDRTREHLAIAREMIGQMGYHRRDREVEELEAML